MIALILATLLAQQPVPATVVPPAAEERVVFTHAGYTYFVGKSTGSVLAVANGATPIPPQPPPVPDDSRPAPLANAKWFSVVVDLAKPEQQAWRTDPDLRKALEAKGVQYRSYLSEELDIDTLGFRTAVNQTGLPLVIVQDASGKVIRTISPKTKDDILKIVDALK